MLYIVSCVVLVFAYTALRALRDEHVVVLRWTSATFLIEHRANGQYRIIPKVLFPVAVFRYGVLSVFAAVALGIRRVHGWATHRPAPAHLR